MTKSTLRCPQCGSAEIYAQNRATVSIRISKVEGEIQYEPWSTEDVEFVDPEWYVCRVCAEHRETIEPFELDETPFLLAQLEARLIQEEMAARDQRVKVSASILSWKLLKIAEKFPAIVEFTFDASYEYDDEGGNFWSASFHARDDKGEIEELGAEEIEDLLMEVRPEEEETKIAFHSEWSEGSITVEQLKADLELA